MILQELHKLAQREKLLEDVAFERDDLHFVLLIDEEGRYAGLESLLDEKEKPSSRLLPKVLGLRGYNIVARFLVDKAIYVLALPEANDKPLVEREAKARARFDAFRALVVRAADETNDVGLRAVEKFLATVEAQRARVLGDAPRRAARRGAEARAWEWKASEVLGFALVGDLVRVDERPAVVDWWRRDAARQSQAVEGDIIRCLVTGELLPQSTGAHAKVDHVPHAHTAGASLISCNDPAFETFGRKNTETVSALGATAYVRALNWLLEEHGGRRFRQGVLLDSSTVITFWTRAPSSIEDFILNFGTALPTATADDAAQQLSSPWRGLEAETVDPEAFFALTLSGNEARLVVRDWLTSTIGQTKTCLKAWFADLDMAGRRSDAPLPLRSLLRSLQARPAADNPGELPPDLATRLFRSALLGSPLPAYLLATAVRRFRVPVSRTDRQGAQRSFADRDRAGLIRCILNREARARGEKEYVTVALDETQTAPAYLLGRLFSVLEQIQLEAQGPGINASIRDRYFGAASTSPSTVFPRLLSLSVHHVSKLQKGGPAGRTPRLEIAKSRILDALPAKPFPAALTLEEQGLFTVGYYHQQQQGRFRKRTSETEPDGGAAATGADA